MSNYKLMRKGADGKLQHNTETILVDAFNAMDNGNKLKVLANPKPDIKKISIEDRKLKKRQDEIIDEIETISGRLATLVKTSYFIKDVDDVESIPGWKKFNLTDVVAAVKHENIIIIANAKGEIFPLAAKSQNKVHKIQDYLNSLISSGKIEIREVSEYTNIFVKNEEVMKIKRSLKT